MLTQLHRDFAAVVHVGEFDFDAGVDELRGRWDKLREALEQEFVDLEDVIAWRGRWAQLQDPVFTRGADGVWFLTCSFEKGAAEWSFTLEGERCTLSGLFGGSFDR